MKFLSTLFLLLFFYINCSAQTPIYRLKTAKRESFNGQVFLPGSETNFYYSGNRGGIAPDADWILESFTPAMYTDSLIEYNPRLKYDSARRRSGNIFVVKQKFDANDNVSNYDQRYEDRGNLFFNTADSMGYVNDKIVYHVGFRKNSAPGYITYRYDNNGRLDSIISGPPSTEMYTYSYTPSGEIAEMKIWFSAVQQNSKKYFYNLANQLESIVYVNMKNDTLHRAVYTYDVNGNRLSFEEKAKGSDYSVKCEYTYDTQGRRINTVRKYWYDNVMAWELKDKVDFAYNAFGLLYEAKQQYWDKQTLAWAYRYVTPTNYTYNAQNLFFDYELAWPTAVDNKKTDSSVLTIYPSPARDVITIETTFDKPQPITATITDMQGRVLCTWNEPSTKEYRRTIPVADLPAGNYVLKVNAMVKQFAVR